MAFAPDKNRMWAKPCSSAHIFPQHGGEGRGCGGVPEAFSRRLSVGVEREEVEHKKCMVEQVSGGDLMTMKKQVLGGQFVQHVFEGGMSAFDNALALGVVWNAEFVENSKFCQKSCNFAEVFAGPLSDLMVLGVPKTEKQCKKWAITSRVASPVWREVQRKPLNVSIDT